MDKKIDLSKFELLEKIGAGYFGEVFVMRNQETHQIYAIKISIKRSRDLTEEMWKDLKQNVKISSKLNYPSIAKFIDYNPINMRKTNRPTIVTEYMPNGSLTKLFKQDVNRLMSIGWNNTKRYINIIGIAKGMEKLHSIKAVHGNLDPNNVLLDCYLYPKITDIGFLSEDNINNMTFNSEFICYKPPEALNDCEYTQKGDVFSFAFIAYQLLTGEKPFNGISPFQIIQRIQKGELPKFKKTFNKSLQNLIEKCWSINPAERPTFSEIVENLTNNESILKNVENKKEYRNYIKYLDSNSEKPKPEPPKIYLYSNSYQEEEEENEDEDKAEEENNEELTDTENSDDDNDNDDIPKPKADVKRICPKEIFEKLSKKEKSVVVSADTNNKESQYNVGHYLIGISQKKPELGQVGFKYLIESIHNGCQRAIKFFYEKLTKKYFSVVTEFVEEHADSDIPEDQLINAILLIKKKENNKALKILNDLRQKRYAKSCYFLGKMYENGWGVEKDGRKAAKYFKEHIQLKDENLTPSDKNIKDDPETLYEKGMNCKTGNNCTVNIKNAIKFFEMAASSNHVPSMKELYEIYYNGIQSVEVDYVKAFNYIKKAADTGDVESMRYTAAMYENEEGTKINLKEACKYYQLAADNGDVDSMNKYGLMLDEGMGTEVDKKKACEYYKMAADAGNQFAMFNYAIMLLNGEGVKVNIDKSIKYLENSAQLGNKDAMRELKKVKARKLKKDADNGNSKAMLQYAHELIEGKGSNKDYATAIEYLNKAKKAGEKNAGVEIKKVHLLKLIDDADNGNVKSMLKYAKMLKNGSPDVKKDVNLSREYYSNAIDILKEQVDDGDPKAMVQYGKLLEFGNGVEKDLEKAAKLFKAAADLDDVDGCLKYAFLNYKKTFKYDKNAHKASEIKNAQKMAFKYFSIASEKGNCIATFQLGLILEHGNGVDKNVKKAFKCYKESADKGYALAISNLARCYSLGIGTPADKNEAFRLYQQAAKKGNVKSMVYLGICYENGSGVKKNEKQAIAWYNKAINFSKRDKKFNKDGKMAHDKLVALQKKMAKSKDDDDDFETESDDEIEFTSSDEYSDDDDDIDDD